MSKNLKDKNGQILVEKMRNLKVGQEDLLKMTDIKLNIMERLVQVAGHFYRYDHQSDNNILIKEGLFMCVDKVNRPEGPTGADYYYIIHVIDGQGKLSYNRSEIRTDAQLQLLQSESTLMWTGEKKLDGTVPAFCFFIAEPSVV